MLILKNVKISFLLIGKVEKRNVRWRDYSMIYIWWLIESVKMMSVWNKKWLMKINHTIVDKLNGQSGYKIVTLHIQNSEWMAEVCEWWPIVRLPHESFSRVNTFKFNAHRYNHTNEYRFGRDNIFASDSSHTIWHVHYDICILNGHFEEFRFVI